MNKILLVFILIGFHSLSFSQIEVCHTCKVKSIKQAVEQADSGAIILVKKGIYKENSIVITKPLTLIGIGKPTIDGENKGYVIEVKSDKVTIDGFVVKNVGSSYTKDYAAIHLYRCDDFILSNNVLENVFFGFLIEKSHQGVIKNNTVSSHAEQEHNSGNGIHLWHCDSVIIERNECYGLRDGIYFEFVTNTMINSNFSHNNLRYGLHFMFSNNNEYHHNHFKKNGSGVAVMFSKFLIMHDNIFENNWGNAAYGLLLKEIYDAELTNNQFKNNTIAIKAEGSTRVNYKNNNFEENGWAVKISGACYANTFTFNNFINNSFDLSYNSKLNDNSFNSNYWNDYTGYDLDKNGVGDIPFRPVKLFNYVVNKTPESIMLMRSLFIDIINFSEKVSPVFTPDEIKDNTPLMKKIPFNLTLDIQEKK
jgi:nitrous oxidase accessory protein